MPPRRHRPTPGTVGFTVLLAGLALVAVLDRGDSAPSPDTAARQATDAEASERRDDVDVDPAAAGSAIETVAGLACQGPTGPRACVTHVAALDLAATDEVQVIRGRIVVASEDGTVSAHNLRDGSRRWQAVFDGPVTLHPGIAASIPISSASALDVLELDSGARIGRIATDARQVAAVGPWIVVDDGDRLAAYGVTGQPGWTRELDGATALLSASGSYVQRQGVLVALFSHTGEQRFTTAISGTVRAVDQQDGRVMLVTDDPPQVVSMAADGTTRSRIPPPGTRLAWASFSPDGSRLVAVTEDADGDLEWLTILDRSQPAPSRHIPLSGRRSTLDPVLDDRVLLVPSSGDTTELLVIDLDRRAVVNRVTTARPVTDIGLAGDGGFATIDDLGMLRVQGLWDPEPAYTVAIGANGRLLESQPLLVRTERAIVTFEDPAG